MNWRPSNRPFRAVGGDYFDVIDLPDNRTLFALADVSGKGTAAALLASNIQALVRSIAGAEADVLTLASRINRHLSRYAPSDRFPTAVFILLSRHSGDITYASGIACTGHVSAVRHRKVRQPLVGQSGTRRGAAREIRRSDACGTRDPTAARPRDFAGRMDRCPAQSRDVSYFFFSRFHNWRESARPQNGQ